MHAMKLLELGLTVRGTWYWNRYPGARFDSESWTYGYSFSQELLEEWHWQAHFAPQPETERYLNHVADEFDLRHHIQFESRVASAHYQEKTRSWDIALEDGRRYSTRFLVTAIGCPPNHHPKSPPARPRHPPRCSADLRGPSQQSQTLRSPKVLESAKFGCPTSPIRAL